MPLVRIHRKSFSFWDEASSHLRVASLLAWTLGLVLLIIGWRLDVAGAWQHAPFVTNMFSALCGALFGVPLALLVLQSLSRHELERAERRAAVRLARRSAEDLRQRLQDIAPDDVWLPLGDALRRLHVSATALSATCDGPDLSWNTQEILAALHEADKDLGEGLALWRSQGRSMEQLQQELNVYRSRWSFVLSAIGPQMLAYDVPFPADDVLNDAEYRLDALLRGDPSRWLLDKGENPVSFLEEHLTVLHREGIEEEPGLGLAGPTRTRIVRETVRSLERNVTAHEDMAAVTFEANMSALKASVQALATDAVTLASRLDTATSGTA